MDNTPQNKPHQDDTPSSADSQPAEGPPRRPSRLDRLLGSKKQADAEAARWDEIESMGEPVPSYDHAQGTTQPFIPEPPVQAGDTPTGRETPPEGLPPIPTGEPERAAPGDTPSHRRAVTFPHPTDSQDAFAEPPVPDPLDQGPGGLPADNRPHQRYQPPTIPSGEVRLDQNGMPLPPRAPSEGPLHAAPTRPHGYDRPEFEETRPSQPQQAAALDTTAPARRARLPVHTQPTARDYASPARPRPRSTRRRKTQPGQAQLSWGCLLRSVVLAVIGSIVTLMLSGGGAAMYYAQVTAPSFRGINDISDLQARALQFQTTRIRDRDGNVLYEINDPEGGFRDYVTLDEVSPYLIHATIATEERDFFTNPGFSIPAIARAVIQNYREGRVVSGASTITQQLTRALLLPEDERYERTYSRKIKEIFLAAELGRRFSKRDILELYLNQAFYGNFAYGIEAAAQTYFNKSARDLTLAEASYLAGLPQAPAVWDPVNNKEATLTRQQQVLALMLEAGCHDTGDTGLALPCVTEADIAAAQPELAAIAAREFQAPDIQARYPHWVVYVQQQLEADPAIGPAIYISGFDVYTTLDSRLQDLAQQQVELTLSGLTDRNVTNASVVIIDPDSGAILAMVGSRNFNDDSIDGQVNIALTPQQPGSSIKPFTYLTTFRNGWTPATVIWDVPIAYEIPGFGVYAPVNYDERFRGPVSVRTALANSLNVPAVLALDSVGVSQLLQTLNDVGITSLGGPDNPNSYGLSLTLGAGEVYLLEWTNAFATIANGGQWRPTYAIERIERNGQVIEGYPYQVPEPRQVIDPAQAFLIRDILSDKEARVPAFGRDSVLSPPYPAGAKTGTTNDFRDNWTMGFTTELAVGVWVGNTDNSPMVSVSGVTGAGPIWRGIMDGSQQWYPAQVFVQPQGLIFQQTVCRDDGALPSAYCQEHSEVYTEFFSADAPPPDALSGLYRTLRVDDFNGLIANDFCPDNATDQLFLFLPDVSSTIDSAAFAREWLLTTEEGRAWASQRGLSAEQIQAVPPTEACGPDTPSPKLTIDQPQPDSRQSGMLVIRGTVDAPNFAYYYVDFGLGPDPQGWGVVQAATNQPVQDGVLAQLDLTPFENGPMTIRVVLVDAAGNMAERRVTFQIENPTPTPSPTVEEEPTAQPTPTPPTSTLAPSATAPAATPSPGITATP